MNKKIDILKKLKRYFDAEFIVTENRALTFKKFAEFAFSLSLTYKNFGVSAGDVIAVSFKNSYFQSLHILSLFLYGAIPFSLSQEWLEKNSESNMMKKVKFILSDDEELYCLKIINIDLAISGHDIWKRKKTNLNQPVSIILTSGSSGVPKGIVHSLKNHYYSALGSSENISFAEGDRWLLSLPLYHISGLSILFRSLFAGGSVFIPEKNNNLPELLIKRKITHVSLVPTQLNKLIEDDYFIENISRLSLKTILVGGDKIPEWLLKRTIDLNLPIHISYGSSEMSSQIATTKKLSSYTLPLTCGTPLKYRKLCIDKKGGIKVGGKTLFYAQFNEFGIKKNRNKWFSSGDLGTYLNGEILIKGRKDNMFICGGKNIHPELIENELEKIPGIQKAIVIPQNDLFLGKVPIAFVKTDGNFLLEEEKINALLGRALGKFFIPKSYYQMPAQFYSNNKINRNAILKYFESEIS